MISITSGESNSTSSDISTFTLQADSRQGSKMVQLTGVLCKYMPDWYLVQKSAGPYFKRQNMLRLTRFHKSIAWSTYKNSYNRFHYCLKGEMYYKALRSQQRRDYNRMRIAAACEEHGYKYHHFQSTLLKSDIFLNSSSLALLSIYEPKTFKALVDISREITSEQLAPANFNPRNL